MAYLLSRENFGKMSEYIYRKSGIFLEPEKHYEKLAKYIDQAKADKDADIIAGGGYDKSVGYFVEPTVILTTNPKSAGRYRHLMT